MDCYYHHAVPSVGSCAGCDQPVCAPCAAGGDCPACRLLARIDAANAAHAAPPAPPSAPSYAQRFAVAPQRPVPPMPPPRGIMVAEHAETRLLAALGFGIFPLALLALLDRGARPAIQRAAKQGIGFNAGWLILSIIIAVLSAVPVIGAPFSFLACMLPTAFVVLSIVYGVRVWRGYDVHIPVITDIIDARLPAGP